MTNIAKKYAYIKVKNYINEQIAETKEKIKECEAFEEVDCALDLEDELEAYLSMLVILSNSMKKIIGG